MVFRSCDESNLLYISISLIFGFVLFVTAIVGFYRGVTDIGYCVFCFRYSNALFDTWCCFARVMSYLFCVA